MSQSRQTLTIIAMIVSDKIWQPNIAFCIISMLALKENLFSGSYTQRKMAANDKKNKSRNVLAK